MATYEGVEPSKEISDVDVHTKPRDVESGGYESNVEITDSRYRMQIIRDKFFVLRYLGRFEDWLEKLAGVETQGIDRIPEEKKRPPSLLNAFLMWFSFDLHMATIPVGFLGPEFGLSLQLSVVAVIVGVLLGSFFTAFCATLGAKLGLRGVATSRYSFGFWGAKLCAVINILLNVGFGVVSVIVAGQLLSAVSDFNMSITVGVVIICIISYVVSIFGFQFIHTFEKYSWILCFILSLVLVGQAAPNMDPSTPSASEGLELSGAFLTFMAISFAYASAWSSVASDYYCNYLASTPKWKIFTLTYFGLSIPTAFALIIGACVANATFAYEPWTDVYEENGFGGLLGVIYTPNGWAKFALVMSTFTVLGTVVATNYSTGLAAQLLGDYFHAVPRLIWSFVCTIACLVLAVAGQTSLSAIISNFCSMLGYWSICFAVIVFIEDQWFRRRDGYDLEAWDTASKLPWGIAAVLALLVGYCCGGVPGMDQTWFVGPIAQAFGGYGGDVGNYLTFAITAIVYFPLRTLEKRWVGR